mmetsp:Transcript_67147/g.151780  ORF Transcript_67147/g.151780 Transcript_67147/m.151780 type:complete len:553 (-) Transcript_67147:167-1825(-)
MTLGTEKLSTARQCVRRKQGEDALRAASEAEEFFRKGGDKSGMADALRAVIVATALKGDTDAALAKVEDELSKFKSSNDRGGQATMLQAKAEVQMVKGLADVALGSATSAESLLEEVVDRPALVASILLTQVEAYLLKKSNMAALNAATKALELATSAGDKLHEAMAWEALMQARMGLCKVDDGLKAAEAALVTYLGISDETGKACTLYSLGKAHIGNRQFQKAMKAGGMALEYFRKTGSTKCEQASLEIIVQGLIGMDAKAEALRQARQGAQQLQKSGDRLSAGLALMTVAKAYSAEGKQHEAVSVAKDAKGIFSELGDKKQEGYATCEISQLYTKVGQPDQGKESAEMAVKLLRGVQDVEGEAYALEMLGGAEDAKAIMEQEMEVQKDVKEMVKKLRDALETRDGPAFKAALDKAYSSEMVEMDQVESALLPLIEKDPQGAREFWEANHPENWPVPKEELTGDYDIDTKFAKAKSYDRRAMYIIFRYGMMGYGPSFRCLRQSYKKGQGFHAHGQSTLMLKDDHEDWEEYTAWHAGLLDCALQTGGARAQP